jgi:autotransporter-associated beta strand protein
MTPTPTVARRAFRALVGSSLLAITSASAQTTYYWDSNSNTAGFGNTTGVWGTNTFWGTSSAGTDATANTTITSVDTVNFGTATLNYATANIGVAAGGVTTGGIVIGAGQTQAITLGTVGNAITIHGGGITKNAGSGTLTLVSPIILGAAQNWTNNGSFIYGNTSYPLSGSAALGINGTGVVSLGGLAGATAYSGKITVSGGQLESRSNITTNGVFGTGNIEINGGRVGLYYSNSLTRAIGVAAGQIQITGGVSGFSGNGGSNSTFSLSGMTWGSSEFNPTELVLQDASANSNGSGTLAGNINLGAATRTIRSDQTGGLAAGGTGTFSGIISNGGITKQGAGTHVFTGANTYAGGTTINAGTLRFGSISAMPNSGAVTVNTGGTLGIVVGAAGDWTGSSTVAVGTLGGLLGGLGGAGTSTVVYSGNVGLNLQLTANTSYAGNITNPTGSTSLALTKTGGSTLTLATGTTNSYTGATSISAGQLTLDGSLTGGGAISTSGSGTFFQSGTGVISGASSYTQNSSGASTLSGNNSYTGGTTLSQSSLTVGHANALGTGTINLNGGTIQSTDTTARSFTNPVTIGGNFTVGGTGNLTFSDTGASALGATRQITVNAGIDATFGQAFSGSTFGITKAGAGTLTLSGANTYTGATSVSAGTLQFTSGGSLSTSGQITVNGTNATLNIIGASVTTSYNNSAAVYLGSSTGPSYLTMGAGGSLSIPNGGMLVGNTGVGQFTQTGGSFSQSMASIITIANNGGSGSSINVSGGTFNAGGINVGVRADASVTVSGDATVTLGTLQLGWVSTTAQSTVNLNGGSLIVSSVKRASAIASFNFNGGTLKASGDSATFMTGLTNAYVQSGDAIIDDGGFAITIGQNLLAGTPSGGLTKKGTGTLTITGVNTYTGGTTVSAGTLSMGNASALGSASGQLTVNSGTLNMAGLNLTVGKLTGIGGIISGTSGTRTLTIGQGDGTGGNFQGTINNGTGGTTALTKTGTGTITLSGNNGYTGATNVNAGTLIINGSTSNASAVTVGLNGTLGGTGTVGGNTTISGIHSPGNSPGIQTFTGNLSYVDAGTPDPTVNWELASNTTTVGVNPTANFDQIIVGGNLDFTHPTIINLSFNGAGSTVLWSDSLWDANQSWLLYDVAGITTNIANLNLSTINWLDSGSNLFSTAGGSFTLSQNGEDVMLNFAAVPEPSTYGLGLGAMALALAAVRRQRQKKS